MHACIHAFLLHGTEIICVYDKISNRNDIKDE